MQERYVELERTFLDLRELEQEGLTRGSDPDEMIGIAAYLRSLKWPDLYRSQHVVVLGEPRSGKTFELRNQATRQAAENGAGFFIPFEGLASESLRTLLGSEGSRRLEAWLGGRQTAFFFLDAVDEARLKGHNFEVSLKRLREAIESGIDRARLILSSRVTSWQAETDVAVFEEVFKAPEVAAETGETEELFLSQPKEAPGIRVVRLAPLEKFQVVRLAEAEGVVDPAEFWAGIEEANADIFAGRPGDVSWLASYWRRFGKFGSFTELMELNIREKLAVRGPTRRAQTHLSESRARSGLEQLAAAATLGSSSLFWLPDELRQSQKAASAVRPERALPDWSTAQCDELLNRGVFDEATSGRVKFHHRTVREFLCAHWLNRLLVAGTRRSSIQEMLFGYVYAEGVVREGLEPVVGWLAGVDEGVREEALRVAPQLLVVGGDPARLSVADRERALERLAQMSQERPHLLKEVHWQALRRYSDSRLGRTVARLMRVHAQNTEFAWRLVALVEVGQLEEARAGVLRIARSRKEPEFLRVAAIQAARAVCDAAVFKVLVSKLLDRRPVESGRFQVAVAETGFPDSLSTTQLLRVFERVSREPISRRGDLDRLLARVVSATPSEDCRQLLEELVKALPVDAQQEAAGRHEDRTPFPVPSIVSLLARTVDTCRPDRPPKIVEKALDVLVDLRKARVVPDYELRPVEEAIARKERLRRHLFWRHVAARRGAGELSSAHWRLIVGSVSPWKLGISDFGWLLVDIRERRNEEERLQALRTAFDLYAESRQEEVLNRLRQAVTGLPVLEKWLRDRCREVAANREQAAEWADEQKVRAEERRAEKEAVALRNRENLEARVEEIETGVDISALRFLWSSLKSSTKWGVHDIEGLTGLFGPAVAEAARSGFKAFWRQNSPLPMSEKAGELSIPAAVPVGLTGLALSIGEGLRWEDLDGDLAAVAAAYGLWEMNGFPEWLTDLSMQHPTDVEPVLQRSLKRGLTEVAGGEGRTLSNLLGASSEIRAVAAPFLQDAVLQERFGTPDGVWKALEIVLEWPGITKGPLLALCKRRAADTKLGRLYWTAWLRLDPESGLKGFGAALGSTRANRLRLIGDLRLGGSQSVLRGRSADRWQGQVETKELFTLARLCYRYVRPCEDEPVEEGVGEVENWRSRAQRTRDGIVGLIAARVGEESYLALKGLSSLEGVDWHRSKLIELASDRAAKDSKLGAWQPEQIAEFASRHERQIADSRQLFGLVLDRLESVKNDVEKSDFSPKSLFSEKTSEAQLQLFFARELQRGSRLQYTVHREEEVHRAKRPDIRIVNVGVEGPIAIEVKIADSGSVGALEEALERQLVGQYLRAVESKFGVLLLAYLGKKRHWRPRLGGRLDINSLVDHLQEQADSIRSTRADVDGLAVLCVEFD